MEGAATGKDGKAVWRLTGKPSSWRIETHLEKLLRGDSIGRYDADGNLCAAAVRDPGGGRPAGGSSVDSAWLPDSHVDPGSAAPPHLPRLGCLFRYVSQRSAAGLFCGSRQRAL